VPNATTAVNIVARSLDLQAGDEVITTNLEYGACVATFERVCAAHGASFKRVESPLPFDAASFVDRMLGACTTRTKVLFLSHITSATALILPVAALCQAARARGITTLVDGAHAPGQIDLNLLELGADFYTGNCHKWLSAPKGTAFLHARPEHHEALHSNVTSWGYLAPQDGPVVTDTFTGRSLLERRMQWQGTRDIAAFLAVPAAIEFQRQRDWPTQRARCHTMAMALMHSVARRFQLAPIAGDESFAQMAPIPVPHRDALALKNRLFDDFHIEVPVTQHAGRCYVRIAVQAYNTAADLLALDEALVSIAPN
jgi:isopenicillin-N epimerase